MTGRRELPSADRLRHEIDLFLAEDRDGWIGLARCERAEELIDLREHLDRAALLAVNDADRDKSWATGVGRGYGTAISWISHRCQIARQQAAGYVRQARFLRKHDKTRAAFDADALSLSKLDRLARVANKRERLFAESEDMLLEQAAAYDIAGFTALTEQWRLYADDLHTPSELGDMRSRFDVVSTFAGCGDVRGHMDPVDTAALLDWLDKTVGPPAEGDTRDLSERKAEALMNLVRGLTDTSEPDDDSDLDADHRIPITADLIVDLDVVTNPEVFDPEHAHCALGHVGPILRTTARAMCCDAAIGRILMSGKSLVIDVGGRTRVIPAATRRALNARDRHCRYPGCTRHYSWCDAHHIVHWLDDGETNLDNLVLLCRRHHMHLHQHHLRITLDVFNQVEICAEPP